MINIKFAVDPGNIFGRQLTELEKVEIPFATMQTMNNIAFRIRKEWQIKAPQVLDNPVNLTKDAAVYIKATKSNPVAIILLRDKATNGHAPAQYLQDQVLGGNRRKKGMDVLMGARGFMPKGLFGAPGSIGVDAHGNISRSQVNAVKNKLKLSTDEPKATARPATAKGKVKKDALGRLRRPQKDSSKLGGYFSLQRKTNGLAPGVYKRVKGSVYNEIRSIYHFVKSMRYKKRYDIFKMAQRYYDKHAPTEFKLQMEKAVASTFKKKFGL